MGKILVDFFDRVDHFIGVLGIHGNSTIADDFGKRCEARNDGGRSGGHRLDSGNSKAFISREHQERSCASEERRCCSIGT